MYYIIKKFDNIDSVVKGSPLGYLATASDKDAFESLQGNDFIAWVEANDELDQVDYFIDHDPFYLIDSVTVLPDGLELIEDINNPEGA